MMDEEEYDFILWQMSMCSVRGETGADCRPVSVHSLVECDPGVYRCMYCRFEYEIN